MIMSTVHTATPQTDAVEGELLTEYGFCEAAFNNMTNHAKDLERENKHLRAVIDHAIPWLGLAIARNIHVDCSAPQHLVATLDAAEGVIYKSRATIAVAPSAPVVSADKPAAAKGEVQSEGGAA